MRRILSLTIYVLCCAIGAVAFLYPFWLPVVQAGEAAQMGMAHANDAPLMTTLLVGLTFIALLLEIQGQQLSAKFVALLGVLVAINSILRFIETMLPGPGGFTPIFFLIVLSGYVFGARFGFLMGAMTLLVSALITGGMGPWLPYQMFTAGWMGLSAGWLGRAGLLRMRPNVEWLSLILFGTAWGFLYGAIMNVWFWPFATGTPDQYWTPGISVADTLRRYATFYVITSLAWDLFAALGNALLIALFGRPTLRALRRFKRRFQSSYVAYQPLQPSPETGSTH
jgi:energy-coupling factor transport system substrate-specific component